MISSKIYQTDSENKRTQLLRLIFFTEFHSQGKRTFNDFLSQTVSLIELIVDYT